MYRSTYIKQNEYDDKSQKNDFKIDMSANFNITN